MSEGRISPAGIRRIRSVDWNDATSRASLDCLGVNVLAHCDGCIVRAADSIASALPKADQDAALPLSQQWLSELKQRALAARLN